MKFIYLLCLLFIITTAAFGQKSVEDIKVYNQWSSFESDTGTWGPWKANDEVFILNYKDQNQIARCRLGSKIIILNLKSDEAAEQGRTATGYSYTLIKATGDFFVPYDLKFFENHPDYGLEVQTGKVRLRFAKK